MRRNRATKLPITDVSFSGPWGTTGYVKRQRPSPPTRSGSPKQGPATERPRRQHLTRGPEWSRDPALNKMPNAALPYHHYTLTKGYAVTAGVNIYLYMLSPSTLLRNISDNASKIAHGLNPFHLYDGSQTISLRITLELEHRSGSLKIASITMSLIVKQPRRAGLLQSIITHIY